MKGGKPLAILVAITAALLLVQNLVGGLGAVLAGLPPAMGVVLGSTSLLGGHGTIIAWTPDSTPAASPGRPKSASPWATSASSSPASSAARSRSS